MAESEETTRLAQLAKRSRAFMENVPLNRALGIRIESLDDGEAVMILPYDRKLVGNPDTGVLHGGAITSMMDACSGAAAFMKLPKPAPLATLDLRIDYLQPATAARDVVARARCYGRTRSVAFVRCVAYHDREDEPIAAATGTFIWSTPMSRTDPQTVAEPSLHSRWDGPHARRELMSDLIHRIKELKRDGSPEAFSDLIPYLGFMGLSFQWSGDRVVGKMSYSDHLVGNHNLPALHGGAIGALLESTAIFELLWQTETMGLPKIINITVQYLRTGRPMDTRARATVIKQGRRVVAVRVEAWQEDSNRPIATADAHFLIAPVDGPKSSSKDTTRA